MATKDLKPGDVLRRFGDAGDPRGGANSNQHDVSSSAPCLENSVCAGFLLRVFRCSLARVRVI